MYRPRAMTAEGRLNLRWSGRPRPSTGRTTRRSWLPWAVPFQPKAWKAWNWSREMETGARETGDRETAPSWIPDPALLKQLHGTCLWTRHPAAGLERMEVLGTRRQAWTKLHQKAPARRPVLSRQADKRISRSLTRAGRAGARTGTAGLARIRNIRSNVPTTRMSYMDVTLKTSPWRLRRLTGRLGK